MERRMLNITIRDKIRNTEIRKQTQVKDIMVKIKEATCRWTGHLMHRDDNRWTRKGKRTGGRQKRRWRDGLTTYMGPTWTRLAQDHQIWQNHEEGYIQEWMDTA